MNNHTHFRQPHFIRTLFCGLCLLWNKKFHTKQPIISQIGNYRLVKELHKADRTDRNFEIGIYTDGTHTYFIKTWQGMVKDSNYYNLLNELLVNETIHGLLENARKLSGISTPRVVGWHTGKHSFSVIFEYIEGKNLQEFPAEFQVRILGRVLEAFETISCELEDHQRRLFAQRGGFSYLVSLPIVVLLAVIHNIRAFPMIIRCAFQCVRAFFRSFTPALTLAHRDIGPDNVIVTDDCFYVVDFERMALTYPLYDITSLGLEPTYTELVTMMKKNFMYVEDEFLRLFIFLWRAAFTGLK